MKLSLAKYPKPPQCENCSARSWGVGYVPPQGPLDAKLAWVGQGPGDQEARTGVPFFEMAPSGSKATRWMYRAEFSRRDFVITNIVWCWLPERRTQVDAWGNRAPTQAEVAFCREAHWRPLLESMPNLHTIVPVGVPALRAFLGPEVGEEAAGALMEIPSL